MPASDRDTGGWIRRTYTVIEVKEPGQFVVQCPVSRANLAQLALAGKLLADGQVVKLESSNWRRDSIP